MVKNTDCLITLWGTSTNRAAVSTYFPVNYVCMSFIAYATGSELVPQSPVGNSCRATECSPSSILTHLQDMPTLRGTFAAAA